MSKYSKKQKEVMAELAYNYITAIENSGMFKNVPPLAHSMAWSMVAARRGIAGKNSNERICVALLKSRRG